MPSCLPAGHKTQISPFTVSLTHGTSRQVHKPIAVSGVLLMDQRFWGQVCADKGVGPPPVHIEEFASTCEDFVDKAFAEAHSSGQPVPTAHVS